MWQNANRTEKVFYQRHEEWLNASVYFPVSAFQKTPINKGGRPSIEFTSCSDRSKEGRKSPCINFG